MNAAAERTCALCECASHAWWHTIAWHPYPAQLAPGYRLALTVGQFYDVRTEHSEYRAEYVRDTEGHGEGEFIFVAGDGAVVDVTEVKCGVEREESNG